MVSFLGLQMPMHFGFLEAIIETGCLEMPRLVTEGDLTFHPHTTFIMACRQIMRRHTQLTIQHVFREANFVAHELAMMGQFHTGGYRSLMLCLIVLLV